MFFSYSSAPSYRQCYWILRFLKEFQKVPFMHTLPKNIMHCLWVEFIYSPYIHIQFTIQKHNIETYLFICSCLLILLRFVCTNTLILWWNFFWIPSEPYKLPSCSLFYKIARLAQSVEHETLNLRVVGSSPTLGELFYKKNSPQIV